MADVLICLIVCLSLQRSVPERRRVGRFQFHLHPHWLDPNCRRRSVRTTWRRCVLPHSSPARHVFTFVHLTPFLIFSFSSQACRWCSDIGNTSPVNAEEMQCSGEKLTWGRSYSANGANSVWQSRWKVFMTHRFQSGWADRETSTIHCFTVSAV